MSVINSSVKTESTQMRIGKSFFVAFALMLFCIGSLQGKAQESRRILDGDAPEPRRMRTGMNPAPRSGAVQHAIIANLAFWAAIGEIALSAIVWRSSALAALCLLGLAAVLLWIGWRAARDANAEI